jgi:hypothetical protein
MMIMGLDHDGMRFLLSIVSDGTVNMIAIMSLQCIMEDLVPRFFIKDM